MKKLLILLSLSVFSFDSLAQVVSVSPAFPTVDDVVTITYHANEGNAALTGVSTVYAHMGLITSTSTSNSNWQFVQGVWGTADAQVLMTNIGNNTHQITIDVDVFYNFPVGTDVQKLAFVFRNATGTIVGRESDGSDIFYDVYPSTVGFLAKFFAPTTNQVTNLNDQIAIQAQSNQPADLSIFDNGVLISSQTNATVLDYQLTVTSPGEHVVELVATNGTVSISDTFKYIVNPTLNLQNPPAGMKQGLNRLNDNSILITLFAPEKENIYLLGDFNNWTPSLDYHMHVSLDLKTWWIQVDNLQPDQRYGYQFLIDGQIKVADPISELIADPNNDASISTETYPNPYPYPTGKTTGFISLFTTNPTSFNWQHDGYERPAQTDLVIYEILVRDFVAKHDYLTLIDTLDYLSDLGINAIELMPVGEFENNESWGYNPSFHMALDKYYGTPEHFKQFVDACHERGIAVILDIALNHTFGQSPMLKMYWDAANNRPAANSPWFNAICPHEPFCWGYDLNHEVTATQNYIDRINHFWMDEYHLDGFRFDYTKGFINNANSFSQPRINLLKRMADTIWAVHPDAYIILEHWADNNEEKQLSNHGMMMWGNITFDYHKAMKGVGSNFTNGVHIARGWNDAHLITYVESHDEERGMYEALTNGSVSNPNHSIKNNVPVSLQRAQAAAVMMLTTPGPKMIWQFGELGYDKSINLGCRVCNKPILWNYFFDSNRKQLYDVYKATIALKLNHETFKSGTPTYALSSTIKRITYQHPDMDALVVANFGVQNGSSTINFTETGRWYEYYTGDSLEVSQLATQITLKPAEYRVYTTKRLTKPEILSTVSVEDIVANEWNLRVFPNPTSDVITLKIQQDFIPERVAILKSGGEIVKDFTHLNSSHTFDVSDLSAGMYLVYIEYEGRFTVKTFVKN